MKVFVWIIRLLLFFLLLGFTIKNDQLVSLKFYLGNEWTIPLIFVILLSFIAGTILGVTAAFMSLLKYRREIHKLRKQITKQEKINTARTGSQHVANEVISA